MHPINSVADVVLLASTLPSSSVLLFDAAGKAVMRKGLVLAGWNWSSWSDGGAAVPMRGRRRGGVLVVWHVAVRYRLFTLVIYAAARAPCAAESRLRSRMVVAYLGSRMNLGTESWVD